MEFNIKKCCALSFSGTPFDFYIDGTKIDNVQTTKDLGITLSASLSWKFHVDDRLSKSLKCYFYLSRNVPYATPTKVKFNLYRTCIISVLMYGSCVWRPNKTIIRRLERFNERCLRWVHRDYSSNYSRLLRISNTIPICYLHHFYDIVYMSHLLHNKTDLHVPDYMEVAEVKCNTRISKIFQLKQPVTKKMKSEDNFFCRAVFLTNKFIRKTGFDFIGNKNAKNAVLTYLNNLARNYYNESNACTWDMCCNCQSCRPLRSL